MDVTKCLKPSGIASTTRLLERRLAGAQSELPIDSYGSAALRLP